MECSSILINLTGMSKELAWQRLTSISRRSTMSFVNLRFRKSCALFVHKVRQPGPFCRLHDYHTADMKSHAGRSRKKSMKGGQSGVDAASDLDACVPVTGSPILTGKVILSRQVSSTIGKRST
jgi:hypothetical protein